MAVFKAYNPKVEVNGETIMSFVKGTGVFKTSAINILKDSGIVNPVPGQWYPQQAWLDAFKTISEKVGKNTLKLIGMSIPDSANFPPQINNIEAALASINTAYHANHRNGKIGDYIYQKTGDRSANVICENPYPCAFNEGIIEAMAKRFKPADCKMVSITHTKDGCVDNGGLRCVFQVKW